MNRQDPHQSMEAESIFQVRISHDGITLDGILGLPAHPRGVIAFAHGSGSGRFSPRNQFVARHLETGGFATLLMDLLTPDEADDRRKVFDIDLLADRLLLAERWLQAHRQTAGLRVGYFGASTGAGAALQAAAREPQAVGAIVSRGGRPDLAGPYLSPVSYTHLRAHETVLDLVCRLLLEKKKTDTTSSASQYLKNNLNNNVVHNKHTKYSKH